MSTAFDTIFAGAMKMVATLTGKQIVLRRTIPGSYDPVTGVLGGTSVTDYEVTTVGPPANYGEIAIDGTLVHVGDMWLVVPAAALSIIPTATTDEIIMDEETWNVVDVGREYSGNDRLLYQIQVRK